MLHILESPTNNRFILALTLIVVYLTLRLSNLILRTYRARQRWLDIPGLPRHPMWGHLINMGEKLNPALNRHPDYAFEQVWDSLGRPDAFLMDMEPVDRCFLIVADPTVSEALVQPTSQFKYSAPKSDTLKTMHRLVGLESLIIAEGEEWKNLRKRFNRGFAPSHLHSLDPLIISKTRIFVDRLKASAEKDEVFPLKRYTQDLTTDIITELTIEKDFQAQSLPEGEGHKGPLGMLTASRLLSTLVFKLGQGFNPLHYIDPVRPTKSWFYEQVYNHELARVIRQQISAEQTSPDNGNMKPPKDSPQKTQQKSITRLALSGLTPSRGLIRNTVSQIKSFLFAGQDTTATMIQWLCFELSKASWSEPHAAILSQLVAEHDAVFGQGDNGHQFDALDILGREDDEGRREAEAILGHKLPYTSAFIKESLRLHPPASTARYIPEISSDNPTAVNVVLRTSSSPSAEKREVNINGLRIYCAQYLIHRNPAVWGADAHIFRPERWLDDHYTASLPTGAWRPFERGPRNCIGQELAMIEAKVVMCAVVRGFSWEKVGMSGRVEVEGIPKGDGTDHPDREVWSLNQVTSVPVDGMRMRVKLKQ
ncbi:uncharacterized protein Z518_02658 [Rhinocladiella mackenziei CBS 650.93]|uniref:Cytochrome P450 n=1 Tax=Rhinocladiella mackenziei CBS 650.93 TaxID=1442369 RepID=A0A0D2HC59_9EURO|nr:uncharacterized protein Z518_02658 [Rhinocladiella mackenziei CBS 650.93]KIX08003.1 hypothetical protein Z518_02658 [Rhinocladiella mackenziei CBS 650.93]